MKKTICGSIFLLFILLVVFTCDVLCSAELERGSVISDVESQKDPSQSYALYLPGNYSSSRDWPVLFVFSPDGNGSYSVRLFHEAAEKYGYIVIGSNNAKNGPWKPIYKAIKAVLDDALGRFSIDWERSYSTGFSGGARMAFTMANKYSGSITGVIPCGAGFGEKKGLPGSKYVYGLCGKTDSNISEVRDAMKRLGYPESKRVAFKVFDGGHQWPAPDLLKEAISWMDRKYAGRVAATMAGVLQQAGIAYKNKNYRKTLSFLDEYLGVYSLPDRDKAEALYDAVQNKVDKAWETWNILIDKGDVGGAEALYRKVKSGFDGHFFMRKFNEVYRKRETVFPKRASIKAEMCLVEGKYLESFVICENIIATYPSSSYAGKAKDIMERLKEKPAFAREYRKMEKTRKARGLLKTALECVENKEYGKALNQCLSIVTDFGENQIARKAKKQYDLLVSNVQKRFDAVEHLRHSKDYEQAMEKLKDIVRFFSETPYAQKAEDMISEMEKDPAIQNTISQKSTHGEVFGLWQIAENFEKSGRPDLAKEYYRQILKKYPDSEFAHKAQEKVKK